MAAAVGKRKSRGTKKRVTSTNNRVKIAVGKRKKRISGTGLATVGRTRRYTAAPAKRKKKRSSVGATKGATNTLMAIAKMAGGLAVGYAGAHYILKPAENWLKTKFPMLGKLMAAGEVFVGGLMALKSKNCIIQAAGVGVAASGVQGLFEQFALFTKVPGINGVDEYTRINVPISGSMQAMIGQMLQDGNNVVYTSTVSGGQNTAWMSGESASMSGGTQTAWMSGDNCSDFTALPVGM